tara:strand:- start:695 stop:922 length:228 start_codon:yes stop_codon:yes gene_type:complete
MEIKGTGMAKNINTPDDMNKTEKPLRDEKFKINRVDINILKSKLQESEAKEFKKNILFLSILVLGLASMGIYFSL